MDIILGKRKVTKVVHLLHDARPELVSIVDHGANQTPFNVLKADKGDFESLDIQKETDMTVRKRKDTAKVTKNQEVSGDAIVVKKANIASISFNAEVFKTDESVQEWLEAKGFVVTDISVSKSESDGNYLLKVKDVEGTETTEINPEEGVTITVSAEQEVVKAEAPKEVASEEVAKEVAKEADTSKEEVAKEASPAVAEPEATTEEAKPEEVKPEEVAKEATPAVAEPITEVAELSKKFDEWLAMESNGTTIAEVFRDADDGLPAGISALNTAFYTALKNLTAKRDEAGVDALVAEFGMKYKQLSEIMMGHDFGGAESTAKAAIQVAKADGVMSQEAIATMVAQAVSSAVTETSKAFSESLKSVMESVQGVESAVSKSVGEATDRLNKLESVSQTRKGADVDGIEVGNKTEKANTLDDEFIRRQKRNQLGISS